MPITLDKPKKGYNPFESSFENNILVLKYPAIEDISNSDEHGWYEALDDLDQNFNVYDNATELLLDTDFYYYFPKVFLKFNNLKKVTLSGCRWVYIDCYQFPKTIELLILNDQSNLPSTVLNGMETLVNLTEIFLSFETFFDCDACPLTSSKFKDIIPIYDLPTLKTIRFVSGSCGNFEEYFDDCAILIDDVIHAIETCDMMKNICHRIKNISFESYNSARTITCTL